MRILEFIVLIKIYVLVGLNLCLEGVLGYFCCFK